MSTTEYFSDSAVVRQHLDESGTEIKPGDWYLAHRNGPPQVLKCQAVDERGWIEPSVETPGYSFDTAECIPFKKSVSEGTLLALCEASRREVRTWQDSLTKNTKEN